MAGETFVKIASVTVGAGGASAITFSAIPQTYTDLKIVLSARSVDTNTAVSIKMNTSTSFSVVYVAGYPGLAAPSSGTDTGQIGNIAPSNASANTFNNLDVYIPNYAGNQNKTFVSDSTMTANTYAVLQFRNGTLANTAAITSVEFYNITFVENSTATLYGILKGSGGATVA